MKQFIYIDNSNNLKIIEYNLNELNNKIIPTSKINNKYKDVIKDTKISGELYLDNLVRNYNVQPKDEKWRVCKCKADIEVSNMGRIRITDSGKLCDFIDDDYLKGYLRYDGEYVYKLVAQTWLVEPENTCDCILEIHHITNDGYDNRAVNLIYLTKCQHSKINHKTKE